MKSAADHVIHAALRKKEDPINVLYLGYDGWFEHIFSMTTASCYMPKESLVYEWKGSLPNTFTVLPSGVRYIPNRIDVDVIICNSRKKQIVEATRIADTYHLPLIVIEHDLPSRSSDTKLREYVNSRLPAKCFHVFPHHMVKSEWCIEESEHQIIPYGMPIINPGLKTNNVLVFGDYDQEDYGLLETMMSCDPEVIGIGNNHDITKPYSNVSDVVKIMSESYVCVMGFGEGRPPIPALMAMSTGAVVVTNKTRWTESIIDDGHNGFLFESATDIKKIVKRVTSGDKSTLYDISRNAQKFIAAKYPHSLFIENWNTLIHTLATKVYKR